jgi:L-gulonate 3-dehydrogenase
LETTHLNAEGFVDYCDKYANTIYSVSKDFKPLQKWEGPQVGEIAKQLENMVPKDKLQERRNWRDLALTKLSQLKKSLQ